MRAKLHKWYLVLEGTRNLARQQRNKNEKKNYKLKSYLGMSFFNRS